jgi:hypothetical protein
MNTEHEPEKMLVDEIIDCDRADTVFGKRWWSQVIELTDQDIAAPREGKYLALDVNGEYIVYLRTEPREDIAMLQTYEALLEPDGHLQFLETPPLSADQPRRVLVTFTSLAQAGAGEPALHEAALLAQPALAEDWLNAEEDAAWAHLQPGK